MGGVSVGTAKGFDATAGSGTSQSASQVASLQGDVTLVAGQTYRQTGSSVLAAGLGGGLAGGDVNILARDVIIEEAANTALNAAQGRHSSTVLGLSASANVAGFSTDSLKGAGNTLQAMGDTGDSRMQALGAVNLAMTGKQAVDAAEGGNLAGLKISAGVSQTRSQYESASAASHAVGSGVVGANNVNIVATGGGEGSNIRVSGSTIAAGNTVNLAADNDITLRASQDSFAGVGRNSSSGASVGVGFAAGSQSGITIDLGVSQGKGRDNQNEVIHNNARVSGGNAVNIASGGDLNLKGAVVEGNRVSADVGGNLNIESLQDVSIGHSQQSSSGLSLSLCIPPMCYGASSVGVSAAGAKADGVHISVNEQSGIKAGDGGFDVKVQGDTTLKGGVIESTQAAVDQGRNSFKTEGELTLSDLQNQSWSKASSYAVSGSVGFMAGGEQSQQQAMKDRGMTDEQIAVASNTKPGGSAGVGSAGSSQTSTTKSGISGIAGDESVRTGDDSSAGTLVKEWNTQALVKDVQAQAQITAEFGQRASSAWGEYANGKLVDALVKDDKEAAACWGDGGACRVAGHAAIGGLAGGASGAAGAASGVATVSTIGEAITNLGLSGPAADAVVAGLALSLGSAVGGASGAAGAFNEAANNFLTSGQVRDMMGKLREAKTQEDRDKILDEYAALSAKQSASIKGCEPAACEAIAADVRDGKKALDTASIELNRLAGDGASGKVVGQIQSEDNRLLFSIGNGWIDSHGNVIDRSQEIRSDAKKMADSVATAAAYGAAGCALTVVCSPAIPIIGGIGTGASIAGLAFEQKPISFLVDWHIDRAMRGIQIGLNIPLAITTPIGEGLKKSPEIEKIKNLYESKK